MQKATQTALLILLLATAAHAETVVQFGGGVDSATNANWQTQIGADQIVQWNGVNSWGGSFNANGSVGGNSGQPVGATIWSSNSVLTLTSVAISSSNPAGTNTFSSGSPNVLGVGGVDDSKFDVSAAEAWTFDFDREVVLKHLIVSAVDGNLDMPTIAVGGVTNFAMTTNATEASAVAWEPSAKRVLWTFAGDGLAVSAGTDITLSAQTGAQWGLQGVVVSTPDLVTDRIYRADTPGNTTSTWFDLGELGKDIDFVPGGIALTSITGSATKFEKTYASATTNDGGRCDAALHSSTTGTVVVWFRKDFTALGSNAEVLFESGWSQGGYTLALLDDNGPKAEARTSGYDTRLTPGDLQVDLSALNLTDFVQLAVTFDGTNATLHARAAAGGTSMSASAPNVSTNALSLDAHSGAFNFAGNNGVGYEGGIQNSYASGGGNGGPDALRAFIGEIAAIEIYERVLSPAELTESYDHLIKKGMTLVVR